MTFNSLWRVGEEGGFHRPLTDLTQGGRGWLVGLKEPLTEGHMGGELATGHTPCARGKRRRHVAATLSPLATAAPLCGGGALPEGSSCMRPAPTASRTATHIGTLYGMKFRPIRYVALQFCVYYVRGAERGSEAGAPGSVGSGSCRPTFGPQKRWHGTGFYLT